MESHKGFKIGDEVDFRVPVVNFDLLDSNPKAYYADESNWYWDMGTITKIEEVHDCFDDGIIFTVTPFDEDLGSTQVSEFDESGEVSLYKHDDSRFLDDSSEMITVAEAEHMADKLKIKIIITEYFEDSGIIGTDGEFFKGLIAEIDEKF